MGYKSISHPQPLALTCHIFITLSTSFSYSQHLKEDIYLHYFKYGKSQNFLLHLNENVFIFLKKADICPETGGAECLRSLKMLLKV